LAKILALYDSDVFYVTRFMEYFHRKNETEFEISVFTRIDSLEDFLKLNYVEILLLGDLLTLEEQILKNVKYVCLLTDNPFIEKDISQLHVNKYQSVRALMDDVLTGYQKKEKGTLEKAEGMQVSILTVAAPAGGLEKINYAWSMSLRLSEENQVLFVMLDLLPIPFLPQIEDKNASLSEFIYYLKENLNIAKLTELVKPCKGLYYLSGIHHGVDIISLSAEDVQTWIRELRVGKEYDTVVFYLGGYTEAGLELIKQSDTILVPYLENTYERAVKKEWERQMNQYGLNTKQKKFRFVDLYNREEIEEPIGENGEIMGSSIRR